MSVWEGGYGEQPEDEREGAYSDPDGWKGGEEWPEDMAGPEYWLNKDEEGDDHGPPR